MLGSLHPFEMRGLPFLVYRDYSIKFILHFLQLLGFGLHLDVHVLLLFSIAILYSLQRFFIILYHVDEHLA